MRSRWDPSRLASPARRAFTLIELMIVVAIVGVLAVLAAYGVSKYIANAKSAEATSSLGQISSEAALAYNINTSFCRSASATVPSSITSVAGRKYQSSASDWNVDQPGGSGFACLMFTMDAPQYYQYGYVSTSGSSGSFVATANGDLDGDGIESTFQITGSVNTSGAVNVAPNILSVNAEE